MPKCKTDIVLIGAGIVGAATARALLLRHPELKIKVLEKESQVGQHQTGHNSGVVHSGIYYKPGSIKAKLCVAGAKRMREFALERGIPYEEVGKLIVATDASQVPALDNIYERAIGNGVNCVQRIRAEQIREHEPFASGVAGIWSPITAIIDYGAVARAFADDIVSLGGEIVTNAEVISGAVTMANRVVSTTQGDFEASVIVNCAGLYSDRVARLTGIEPGVRIVPFRGEYYRLTPEAAHMVRGCIYPVPDPTLPFLGVHFTPSVHGGIDAGPNAVLALAREGYSKRDFNAADIAEVLKWPGFRTFVQRYWRTGLAEMARSLSKAKFAASLSELVPAIRPAQLAPGGSGVRAQAVNFKGDLIDDFQIIALPGIVHVLNVPSPAATASLAIADYLSPQIEILLN